MTIKTVNKTSETGAAAAFSLLRPRESLATFIDHSFEQNDGVVLHAPNGAGARSAVLQWLYARRKMFTWVRWRAEERHRERAGLRAIDRTGETDSARSATLYVQDQHQLLEALSGAGLAADNACWVVENKRCDGDGDGFPWREILALSKRGAAQRLIIVTPYVPSTIMQSLGNSWTYRACFNDLALSLGEINTLIQMNLPGQVRASLGDRLFALSHGWARAVFAALRHEPQTWDQAPPDLETALEDRCRAVVRAQVERAFAASGPRMGQALALLEKAGPLPERIYGAQGPLTHQQALVQTAQGFAWVVSDADGQEGLWVRCGNYAQVLLNALPQRLDDGELNACTDWLAANGYEAAAVRLLIRTQRWERVEALLLEIGDRLVARLQVDDFSAWLRALDGAREIRYPRLLLDAVRCGIYQGDGPEVELYFQRLLDLLASMQPSEVAASMSATQWARFGAELLLYARLLKRGEALCEQWSSWSEGAANGGSAALLLQQAYSRAEAGDLAGAYPLLAAGVRRSEVLDSAPTIIAYASIHFWVLVLSCQVEQAEQFLDETRARMVQGHVAYRGVYDCLDLLTILLARVRGDLDATTHLVDSLLASDALSQDFLRRHVVLNIHADLCLARREFYPARHAVARLAALQKSPSTRSYWFASSGLMQACLNLFEQDQAGGRLDLPAVGPLTEAVGSVQKQTELLWHIKMQLHWGGAEDLLPVLEQFAALCTRTGQWLRLLEVDLLRAVCLYRCGDKRAATGLFTSVVDQVVARGTLGILIDPFLLWREFLRDELKWKHQERLVQLYRRLRPEEPVESLGAVGQALSEKLSRREREILALLAQGLKNQEIADALHVSITTVRSHVQNIYRKLQVSNRPAATAAAIQNQLV